jgi:TPR repeat protein
MGSAQVAKLSPAENAELGRKLLESGNFGQARVHLEQAVKGGDGGAACHLGDMTLKGQGGITASQEKAASLFQLAQFHNIICFASSK